METVFLGLVMLVGSMSLLAFYVTMGVMGTESLSSPLRDMAVLEAAAGELYHEVMAPYDGGLGDHDHMALRAAGVEQGSKRVRASHL